MAGDATLGSPLTSTKIVKAEFRFSCTTRTGLQAHLLSPKLSLVPPSTLLPRDVAVVTVVGKQLSILY